MTFTYEIKLNNQYAENFYYPSANLIIFYDDDIQIGYQIPFYDEIVYNNEKNNGTDIEVIKLFINNFNENQNSELHFKFNNIINSIIKFDSELKFFIFDNVVLCGSNVFQIKLSLKHKEIIFSLLEDIYKLYSTKNLEIIEFRKFSINSQQIINEEFEKVKMLIKNTQENTREYECKYYFDSNKMYLVKHIEKRLEQLNYSVYSYSNFIEISWYYD